MDSAATSPMDGKNSPASQPKLRPPRIIRWRIIVKFPDPSQIEVKQWFHHGCKLCAVRQAMRLARGLEIRWDKPGGHASWSVAKPVGHMRGYEVVAHSGQDLRKLAKNHAH
jgi:hypothetical protein